MPPSIWAAMMSGLIGVPQSTAHTTRSTLTCPSLPTLTSATWATKVLNASATAMPRPLPGGKGVLQPAFSAASSSTAFMRGCWSSSLRRNVKPSWPAACATSSMKASTAKAVCELPTTRHHRTGTPVVVVDKSTATLGMAYAMFAAPSTDVPSTPSFINPANGVPAIIDWPTMTCRQPVSWPSAFRPASSL